MTSFQEQALAYLKGELNAKETTEFEEALIQSQELRDELQSSRELLDLLTAANEEAVVKQVNLCIQQAIKARASDIHIVGAHPGDCTDPARDGVIVSFRIDGRLQEWTRMPKEQQQRIVDRWKLMAEMNIAERRIPQDGRIPVRYEGRMYDLRVNVLPTVTGERITARILNRDNVLLGLDKLGMNEAQQTSIRRMLNAPRGMVMVGGFEGNGKTTLLYSMLSAINEAGNPRRNIMTIEDPVEMLLPGMTQTQVDRKSGLTFTTGLRCMLRTDPEVVYVSQMRNLESAELCIEMALTGQMVLSQLHVSSALGIVQRMREMGIENFLVGYTLLGAIGLRLVRRICPECREEYTPSLEDLHKAGLSPAEDGPFYRGAGCSACRNTGFSGRIGLFEVLEANEAVKQMIIDRTSLNTIWWETFGRNGGSLWDDARDKVLQGLTTLGEVNWALSDYPHPRNSVDAAFSARVEL